ncbi:hypothetical protein BS78_05G203700 [Paspalum vaginatum]|nr:hypothetical protein BS78_05G203700 [Paspalum vaginatum]
MARRAAEDGTIIVETALYLEARVRLLRARISGLLEPAAGGAGHHRVVTSDYGGRRCLAFIHSELSFTAEFMATLRLNSPQDVVDWDKMMIWLPNCNRILCDLVDDVVVHGQVDDDHPCSCCTLQQCFCGHRRRGRYSYGQFYRWTLNLYNLNEDPDRYYSSRHHLGLVASSMPDDDEHGITVMPGLVVKPGALPMSAPPPLVGIDRHAFKLVSWLRPRSLGEGSRLRVMAIVGPAGIGKTTLAMELRSLLDRGIELRSRLGTELHHDIIDKLLDPASRGKGRSYYFEYDIIMAQVSRRTNRNKLLLRHILSEISEAAPLPFHHQSQPTETLTVEQLACLVSERLLNKRYLITIDDMYQESDWEEIKGAFPDGKVGSRILITTRLRSTARAACFSAGSCDGLLHEMKPLNQVDSECLLFARAFGHVDGRPAGNMKPLCDEILSKCGGIPLFITGMADSLREQFMHLQQEAEGKEHQRFESYCKLEQVLHGRFEQALSSAFNDLPEGLRLPSLYLSMFPSGYKFDKDRLVRKWKCEGLCDSMSKAERLFSELVGWNVIISCVPATADLKHKQDEGQTRQWHVNHFMHQFLASKAAVLGFALNLNLAASASASARRHGNEAASRKPRRLAIHHPDPNIPSLLEAMDFSQTRSLAVSGAVRGTPLDKFVNLVVLDLGGWVNFMDEDLLQLCRSKMLFLRYLSIRNTRVSKIPLEMKEAKMLETLDASYTQISELPIQVLEGLTRLQHLDIQGTRITQLPKQTVDLLFLTTLLIGCEGTMTNPIEEIAAGVVPPYKVETLATVDLTQQPASFVRALGDLSKLKVLAITWSFQQSTERDCCKALLSSIQKWRGLQSLTIHCGLGCSMEFLGAKMDRPPKYLQKFKVTAGRFASVPRWLNGLQHLAFVQITICKQRTDDLKILGDLPRLQTLILGLDFIPGQAVVIENAGFPQLQRLCIDCPMPWLRFTHGALEKLRCLQLKFCATPASENEQAARQQTRLPSGIGNLRRITEVALCYNAHYINAPNVKMTVKAVRKQVTSHPNPIELYTNGIEYDEIELLRNGIGHDV